MDSHAATSIRVRGIYHAFIAEEYSSKFAS